MSHRMVLTISDDHYKMLETLQENKGLDNVQETIRSILEDVYTARQAISIRPPKINRRMEKQAVGVSA